MSTKVTEAGNVTILEHGSGAQRAIYAAVRGGTLHYLGTRSTGRKLLYLAWFARLLRRVLRNV